MERSAPLYPSHLLGVWQITKFEMYLLRAEIESPPYLDKTIVVSDRGNVCRVVGEFSGTDGIR